ncbi:MAG: class I SAM-dependent methyltransferase [Bacteroidales bacterium]|nr:class I SAM-dependent methyltransferase [Bacteroidales bacterium]
MILLETPSQNWSSYELVDSGNGEKLERFGNFVLRRPEPKALWDKSLSESRWMELCHTSFTPGAGFGKAGKEDSGVWNMHKAMPEQWTVPYLGADKDAGPRFTLRLGLTSFKHVGVFPEQAPNWDFIFRQIISIRGAHARRGEKYSPKVLNLFAYTGAASLAARAAGAQVTHLDSVRQVVTWARNNMELSSLDNIRWIIEDAFKFVVREARRGNVYDAVMLDPPAYGHGPDGERWKLDECLFDMLKACNLILAPKDSFLLLNLYSNGYSAMLADSLVAAAFGTSGERSCGELMLTDRAGRNLPLSVFSRLIR